MTLDSFLKYLEKKGYGFVKPSEEDSYFYAPHSVETGTENKATLVWVQDSRLNVLISKRTLSTTRQDVHEFLHDSIPVSAVRGIGSHLREEGRGNGIDYYTQFHVSLRFDCPLGEQGEELTLPVEADEGSERGDRERLIGLLNRIMAESRTEGSPI